MIEHSEIYGWTQKLPGRKWQNCWKVYQILQVSLYYYNTNTDYSSLNILHRCTTKEDNDMLFSLPTLIELQDCLMSIDIDIAPRPDGLSGYFYQSTCCIIVLDLHEVGTAFSQVISFRISILIFVLFLFLRLITPNLFLIWDLWTCVIF